MRPTQLCARLIASLATVTLVACATPVHDAGDAEDTPLATETQSLRSTVKVSYQATLITDFAVPLGCASLNGSMFLPDPTGNTDGTVFANSDCHWNAAKQLCDCTVTITQLSR